MFTGIRKKKIVLKNKFSGWMTAVLIILSLAVGAHFTVSCGSGENPKKREKVTLGISKSFLSIPIYIADTQGYFAKEGLDVTIIEYTSGKLAMKGMFAGDVDLSTVADIPIVFNGFKRQDFFVFATFTQSYHFVGIIAHNGRGIETGTDLKGKKVGINRGTSSHFYLGVFLINHGLSASDVDIVDYETPDLPNALHNNEVDAISAWQPYSQETIRLLQGNAMQFPDSEIYRTTFNLVAMKNFAGEHPEILEKLLRALDKAVVFIKTNEDESHEIIAKIFQFDKSVVSTAWPDFGFKIILDQSLLLSWEEIARWILRNKLANGKTVPNYLDIIYLDALKKIKPGSVTIIH